MKTWIAVALFSGMAFAQNVQTPPSNAPSTTPAPIFAANSRYLQGVGLGYWPTAGTGLTLNLASGHARCGNTMVNYAAGTVALTDNATNYVGLNTASSCVPVVNTSGYTSTMISVATVTTSSGVITTLFDDRIMGMTNPGTTGGTGCILPGVNTAVLTEHPIGTCFGNTDFTWDDTNFNLINGDHNTIAPDSSGFAQGNFVWGASAPSVFWTNFNAIHGNVNFIIGSQNTIGESTSPVQDSFALGISNNICDTGNEGTPGCTHLFSFGSSADLSGSAQYAVGEGHHTRNTTGPIVGNAAQQHIYMFGSNAEVDWESTVTGTPTFGPKQTYVYVYGEANQDFTTGPNNYMLQVHQMGYSNKTYMDGTGNTGSQESLLTNTYQVGENNDIEANGGGQSIGIYQFGGHNYVSNDSPTQKTSDVSLVGTQNQAWSDGGIFNVMGAFGDNNTVKNCNSCFAFGQHQTVNVSNTVNVGISALPEITVTASSTALASHLNQDQTKRFAGTCAMSSTTSCTFTLVGAYTGTPICLTNAQGTTAIAGACSVSGTTVTITAASSNSQTWGAMLVGNPN